MDRKFTKKTVLGFVFFIMLRAVSYAEEVKISVNEDGIYRITQSDLKNAGLDLSAVDPGTIKIINKGTETPVFINGEQDGSFDASDYIEFYGIAVRKGSPDYPYTETNIYWLKSGGPQGLRMQSIDGSIAGAGNTQTEVPVSLHVEKNTYFWQPMPDGAGVDHWFWGNRTDAPGTAEYSFSLNNISTTAADAAVRVNLFGKTGDISKAPDHHTQVYINNCLIEDKHWDGQVASRHEGTVLNTCLVDGVNTVKVTLTGDTGAGVDQVFMDWIEIEYQDQLVAENDTFLFSPLLLGINQFNISGFSQGQDVLVFDITSQGDVKRVVNNTTQAGITRFEVNTRISSKFIALTANQIKSPAALELDSASGLKAIPHQADYIMITYDGFYDNVLPLAAHHTAGGLKVKVVTVSDVYDEFNYGIRNPKAIKDFLSYAYNNWLDPAPLYVLLVGDGNIDIKDNFKKGNKSLVPTYYIETQELGRTPSDNWFVSVSGKDFLPDMFIGRISAQTPAEVDAVVNKIKGYAETAGFPWSTTVQFVADDDLSEFETLSDDIISNHLSPEYSAKKVYLSKSTASAARAEIINNLDRGVLITNYSGHGSISSWGNNMLSNSDISGLNNQNNLTFMVILNCLNGFFPLPVSPWATLPGTSLGEQLLLEPGRGAIASFASTEVGYPSDHSRVAKALFDAIMKDGKTILGEATTQAKIAAAASGASGESVNTFVLLGDPALNLKAVQNGSGGVDGAGSGSNTGGSGGGSGAGSADGAGSENGAVKKGGGGCFIGVAQNNKSPAKGGENTILKDSLRTLALLMFVVGFYIIRRRVYL